MEPRSSRADGLPSVTRSTSQQSRCWEARRALAHDLRDRGFAGKSEVAQWSGLNVKILGVGEMKRPQELVSYVAHHYRCIAGRMKLHGKIMKGV
ncbi:hypothetical protein ACLQ24_07440 [Micromonospora sp. DT4]|uniref:hypothetical protein n=1 Tax=Micromonospora sp. DT4 TaxID=3393438 RepID=UPI003CEB3E5C